MVTSVNDTLEAHHADCLKGIICKHYIHKKSGIPGVDQDTGILISHTMSLG